LPAVNIYLKMKKKEHHMQLLKSLIILIVGFVLLIKGADFFVEGSSAVAKRLRIPSMIIGMTIVAMGTSLPECAVSVTASLTGNNSLAISNAVGSNIFNLLVVCGVCTLFVPLAVQKSTLQKEFPLSIFCAGLLLLLGYLGMTLGRIDGILFLIIFTGYLLWMIRSVKRARRTTTPDAISSIQEERISLSEEEIEQVTSHINLLPAWKCLIFILGGMIAIKYGGDFVVDGASAIAVRLGLSQTLIGLTIIAMGTSLPELVTSIVAARKDEVDMALGNVIGSNIFNILLVLGVAAAISPVAFAWDNMIDIAVLIVISVITLIFAWTSKELNRKEGIIMLILYAAYMVYICIR
jgi:cation:H+ antiporter